MPEMVVVKKIHGKVTHAWRYLSPVPFTSSLDDPALNTTTHTRKERLERPWAVRDEGRADLLDAVGERELEVRREQLLDVWAADVRGLLDLDDAEDLE